jgi:hypothetical protein
MDELGFVPLVDRGTNKLTIKSTSCCKLICAICKTCSEISQRYDIDRAQRMAGSVLKILVRRVPQMLLAFSEAELI